MPCACLAPQSAGICMSMASLSVRSGCIETEERLRLQEAAPGAPMHHALAEGHARLGWDIVARCRLWQVLLVQKASGWCTSKGTGRAQVHTVFGGALSGAGA